MFKGPLTPGVRVSLHQHCDDACDIALIDHTGISPKWVPTLFSSNSIVVNESYVTSEIAALTQTDSDARCIWVLNAPTSSRIHFKLIFFLELKLQVIR